MAPLPYQPCPGIYKVEMFFQVDNQVVENVFHVRKDTELSTAQMSSVAGVFKAWWDSNLKAKIKGTVSLTSIKVTSLATQDAPVIYYSTGLPLIGTSSPGVQLPNHVTVAIKWLTDLRGRSYRGRTYHVGLHDAQLTTGRNTLNTADATALKTAYDNLISALIADPNGTVLVVLSRYLNKVRREEGQGVAVTTSAVDLTVDSQRRRLPGRGR